MRRDAWRSAAFLIAVVSFAQVPKPTLYVIGDSTASNKDQRPACGLSSRTYITQVQWDRVLANVKPGDLVVIQFGHNDNGPLNDNSRARGTIQGIGSESEEIDNILTGKAEIVHS